MNFGFQDFSILWILFCVLLASAYTYIFYKSETKFSVNTKRLLASTRFIIVLTLSLFLFSPLITRNVLSFEKPIILLAQDNSSSILMNKKSNYYLNEYLSNRTEFIEKLKTKFDVKEYTFGAELSESNVIDYSEKKSNTSLILKEAINAYRNRNLAAIVLASDGIHNSGVEPQTYINKINSPVYTLLMGDSTAQRDLRIVNIVHNELVYLRNDFVVELKLNAFDLINNVADLSIEHKGKIIWKANQKINSDNQQLNLQAILNATEPGMQKYTLKASPLPNEKNLKNNTREFYIDIIENKQQIALVAAAPHPDLAAIKNSIERNENYKVDLFIADEFDIGNINKYQLLIIHQLPSSVASMSNLFDKIEQQNIACWLILGNQSYLDLFNRLPFGLKILNSKASANEVFGVKQGDFQGFVLSEEWDNFLKELPPLSAPYGTYKTNNAVQTLLSQRIGAVQTDQPLLSFGNDGQRKYAILCAEGIWKWHMQNVRTYGNTDLIDELNSKIVQYLSAKDDKRKFRVSMPSYKIEQGEKVYFNAELYNDSYELVNTPEVKLSIQNQQNKNFNYIFSKTNKSYEFELTELPSGEYRYLAECTLGNKKYNATGRFSVMQNNIEELNTVANFEELRMLSKLSGGKAFKENEFTKLADELLLSENYKTISYEEKRTEEFINLKWIFFFVILLFTIEWVLRKYHGAY